MSRSCCSHCSLGVLAVAVTMFPSLAYGAPLEFRTLVKREAGPASIAIWIPIVGVALLSFAAAGVYFWRQNVPRTRNNTVATASPTISSRIRTWSQRPVNVPGVQQTRELTAEQLAGGHAGIGRNNRARRARSTASTRSTRSLPLYNKEPGEQEVVVFRGTEELAEERLPSHTVLASVAEGGEGDGNSVELARASTSSFAGVDTPLLEREQEEPASPQLDSVEPSPAIPALSRIRASLDTVDGDSSSEPLMHSQDNYPHGPAPAYSEAISHDSGVAFNESVSLDHGDGAATSSSSQRPAPAERSGTSRSLPGLFGRSDLSTAASGGLSSLLHIFPRSGGHAQRLSTANPADNEPATTPGSESPQLPADQPHISRRRPRGVTVAGLISGHGNANPPSPTIPFQRVHRPSTSGSSSGLSAVFRTRSNTSAAERLVSPSMLSLHSIGSPLTHTVVKTELSYPRSGPTPEQMKLIASVDSFKRFGVPYGPDAVAYASASRVDLSLGPPPEFEEVIRLSPNPSPTPGHSREPSAATAVESTLESAPAHNTESGIAPEQPSDSSMSSASMETVPASEIASASNSETTDAAEQPSHTQTAPAAGEENVEVQEESKGSPETNSSPPPLTAEDVKKILRSLGPPISPKASVATSTEATTPVPATISTTTETASPIPAPEPASESVSTTAATPAKALIISPPAPSAKMHTLPAPPSAFKASVSPVASVTMRPGSRASSHMTFLTAEEGFTPPATPAMPAITLTDADAIERDGEDGKDSIASKLEAVPVLGYADAPVNGTPDDAQKLTEDDSPSSPSTPRNTARPLYDEPDTSKDIRASLAPTIRPERADVPVAPAAEVASEVY